jgi:hypothetical protein
LRRAEIGFHRHIVARIRSAILQESSGREDNCHVSNGDQVSREAALAIKRGKSVDLSGYWLRHFADRDAGDRRPSSKYATSH